MNSNSSNSFSVLACGYARPWFHRETVSGRVPRRFATSIFFIAPLLRMDSSFLATAPDIFTTPWRLLFSGLPGPFPPSLRRHRDRIEGPYLSEMGHRLAKTAHIYLLSAEVFLNFLVEAGKPRDGGDVVRNLTHSLI